jgi:hypothetical protein
MSSQDLDSRVSRLENILADFSEDLQFALRYIQPDAASSLMKSRTILEKLVLRLYVSEMGKEPRKPLLGDMLADNQFTRKFERRIVSRMNAIRELANLGSHGERVQAVDAVRVLDDLCEVLEWYLQRDPSSPASGRGRVEERKNDSRLLGEAEPLGPAAGILELKYYVYVSRSKVEMLYAQIPLQQRRTLAATLQIDVPQEGHVVPDSESIDAALSTKTKLVVAFLENQDLVGTIDEPRPYFKGRLPMRWGTYAGLREVVYFGGETAKTILGLGGSLKHVVGLPGACSAFSYSATPYLVHVLSRELGISEKPWPDLPDSDEGLNARALRAVELATQQCKGPMEEIDFCARTLLRGTTWDGDGRQVVLGSPIYAALIDV